MKFEIVPAYQVAFADQVKIFNRAFAGYLAGWHDMDAAAAVRFISAQGVDLCHSRFVRTNGDLVGFGFINRTGNISRLAGMGTVAEARRSGAAAFLLSHLLDEARKRDDHAMVLEVFEQNVPALSLYRRHGFRELMRLLGWRRPPGAISTPALNSSGLEEISQIEAAKMSSLEFPDIPWQISRHAVLKIVHARAYKIDNSSVVIANPKAPPVRIHALFGNDAGIRTALTAIVTKYDQAEFFAPAVFPERFAETVFRPLGFNREPLDQFLMRCDLR